MLALAAVGLGLVVSAVPRIVSGALIFPHEPAMRLVQRGVEVPIDQLVAARRAYEAAIAWHAGASERAALTSLRLRLALALSATSPGGRALLDSARDAARQALATTPADPYLWAQLAEAERLMDGPGPRYVAALMRSIATGPYEPTLVAFRAAFGLQDWAVLKEHERADIAEQVRAAAVLQPSRLRRAAVDPLRQRLVAEILEDQPELYARFKGEAP